MKTVKAYYFGFMACMFCIGKGGKGNKMKFVLFALRLTSFAVLLVGTMAFSAGTTAFPTQSNLIADIDARQLEERQRAHAEHIENILNGTIQPLEIGVPRTFVMNGRELTVTLTEIELQ